MTIHALRPLLLVPVLAAGTALAVTPIQSPPTPATAAASITGPEISRHIEYLASDKLEGRAPGSPGDAMAQQYIADQMKALGLKPGAPGGGWLQVVDLISVDGHPETLQFERGDGKRPAVTLKAGTEFMAYAGSASPTSTLDKAELVFVGFGIDAPEFKWDDFKGQRFEGKVLVVMNSDPEDDPALFAGKTRLWYGRWDYKYEQAAKVGAAGVLIIHTTESAGYPWQVVQTSWAGEQFELPAGTGPATQVRGWVTDAAAKKLFTLAGKNLDALRAAARKGRGGFTPVPLGITLSTAFKSKIEQKRTQNVIGVLPGSDPALAKEAVLYTAHHDHLGVKANAIKGEDAIYNGAVDNASGVAEMLAVAKAFTELPRPPRRSVYFAAVAGEEQGLLGSEALAKHPPIPPGRIAANVNIDGANIWGRTKDVTIVGMGKSSLDKDVEAAAAGQGRAVHGDLFPDRGFFYRSDQFSFAKLGVPATFFDSGVDYIGRPKGWGRAQREAWEAKHYHQPSDEFDPKWDLSGAVDDTRLYFEVGRRVAEADALPTWSPGDEFEGARRQALDAVNGGKAAPPAK